MNYLAHGYRFLDRPFYLAGTAVPDWLNVVNRRVRVRSRLVKPVVDATDCDVLREIGQGVLQHQADDDVFHRSELFQTLQTELGGHFRRLLPDPYDHRPGFLGHIVIELMLDATLAETDSTLLDRFYAVLEDVDGQAIEDAVNQMATQTTDRLSWFIQRFREERFLYDYLDDDRMRFRLNQVLRRVKLSPLDPDVTEVLAAARALLRDRGHELLQVVADSGDNLP